MKKWQKVLLGTAGVLGACAWLWWQDEPLAPQAQAWLEPPAESAESAAYYQLLGLDAPAGQEPQAVGRQLLQAHILLQRGQRLVAATVQGQRPRHSPRSARRSVRWRRPCSASLPWWVPDC